MLVPTDSQVCDRHIDVEVQTYVYSFCIQIFKKVWKKGAQSCGHDIVPTKFAESGAKSEVFGFQYLVGITNVDFGTVTNPLKEGAALWKGQISFALVKSCVWERRPKLTQICVRITKVL